MINQTSEAIDARARPSFFAVASGYFFERPDQFKRNHPELYAMMVQCFKQDPKYVSVRKKQGGYNFPSHSL